MIILAGIWGDFGGALIYKELHVFPIQINRTLILFKNLSPLKRIRQSIITAKYDSSRSIKSACCWIVLGGLFTPPAHAAPWTLYAKAAVAVDLNPQRYATWQWDCQRQSCLLEDEHKRLFVPGPMDDVGIGIESGPLFLEIRHLSAIEDGFSGHGMTWFGAGLRVNIWSSR